MPVRIVSCHTSSRPNRAIIEAKPLNNNKETCLLGPISRLAYFPPPFGTGDSSSCTSQEPPERSVVAIQSTSYM
ncbi:uncharacterized protein VTP21DRAFT_6313 [Calcarisporiella thermophila]|uniref:uncharacterized protein n=1 Tax=Calcarisporiella thermophila TaxID=911321 RepID=UPI0037437C28